MSTEKLKVPLKEEGRFGLDFERCYRKKRTRKIQILLGVCFLLILNVSMFIFTMFTLSRVKKLENEVDWLKNTLNDIKILDDNLMNAILGFEEDGFYEEDQDQDQDMDSQSEPDVFMGKIDDTSDYLDYNYDQSVQNETDEVSKDVEEKYDIIKLATSLTKQGKESLRKKRNIIAATQDGVLINSEPYAERRSRNNTRHRSHPLTGYTVTPVTARPSYFGPTPWVAPSQQDPSDYTSIPIHSTPYRREQVKHPTKTPPQVYTRRSRVMHTEDKSKAFRQVVKKSSLKSGDTVNSNDEENSEADFTIVRDENLGRRRYRERHYLLDTLDERHPRVGRIRLPSVHYSGDTSRYVVGQHTNFNGNGHLRHPQSTFVDWKISDWVKSAGMDTHFTMEDGVVTIKEPGIYFIYAQIYYLDEHDLVGFRVHKNSDTLLQCTITTHSAERRLKGNTCYTAGADYLAEGDRISLADVSRERYSLFEPGKSFFGLIKFGDVKIK